MIISSLDPAVLQIWLWMTAAIATVTSTIAVLAAVASGAIVAAATTIAAIATAVAVLAAIAIVATVTIIAAFRMRTTTIGCCELSVRRLLMASGPRCWSVGRHHQK